MRPCLNKDAVPRSGPSVPARRGKGPSQYRGPAPPFRPAGERVPRSTAVWPLRSGPQGKRSLAVPRSGPSVPGPQGKRALAVPRSGPDQNGVWWLRFGCFLMNFCVCFRAHVETSYSATSIARQLASRHARLPLFRSKIHQKIVFSKTPSPTSSLFIL